MCIFTKWMNIANKFLHWHCSKFLVHALAMESIFNPNVDLFLKREKKNSKVDLLLIEIAAYHSVVFSISISFSPGNLSLEVALFGSRGTTASGCGLCLPAQLHCVAVSRSSATTWSAPPRRTAALSLVLTQIYCKRCTRNKIDPIFYFYFLIYRVKHTCISPICYRRRCLMHIRLGPYSFPDIFVWA